MKTTTIRRAVLQAVAASLLLSCTIPLHAADFPTKPVKVIVSFPPAGLTDVVARLISARLSERLKQPVVVENKPGAGGNLGAAEAARAPADGYTLLMASPPLTISPALYSKLPYKPEQIARLGNRHLIYPAFGRSEYQEIIRRRVAQVLEDYLPFSGFAMAADTTLLDWCTARAWLRRRAFVPC